MAILTVNKFIRLETIHLSMAETIFLTINRDRKYLSKWLPFVEMTRSVEDTEEFIQNLETQKGKKKDEVFSIWYKEEFAGLIGLKETDWLNKKTELGYWLAENMQGKGIINLSVKRLIIYAFQQLKLNRVQIKVAVGNDKSAAIPERLGFTFEGIERAGELHQNDFLDIRVYSLLKKDILY